MLDCEYKSGTICVFSTRWGAHFGGINVFNREMCISIKKTYDAITLICVVEEISEEEILDANNERIELICMDKNSHPIEIIDCLNQKEIFPLVWIGHDIYTGPRAIGCSKLNISTSAVISHFDYEYYGSYKGNIGPIVEEKMREQKKVLGEADITFSVGPKLAKTVHRLTKKDSTVLNPGCFDVGHDIQLMSKGCFIMSSGRLEVSDDNIKRVSIVMNAYSKISKEIHEDKMLTIFGMEIDRLHEVAHKNSRNVLNIKALPFSSNRDHIFDALSQQTMFIMPSLHEGFGLTGLEAISMKIPLVLTSNSGLFEMLEEYKLLNYVEVVHLTGDNDKDSLQIYTAMQKIYGNKELWFDKAKTLKEELSKEVSWGKLAETIVDKLCTLKKEDYFTVKSQNDLDEFKSLFETSKSRKLLSYLFFEYRKISDANNGKLEQKYGDILYQIVLMYKNSERFEQELQHIEDDATYELFDGIKKAQKIAENIVSFKSIYEVDDFLNNIEDEYGNDIDSLLRFFGTETENDILGFEELVNTAIEEIDYLCTQIESSIESVDYDLARCSSDIDLGLPTEYNQTELEDKRLFNESLLYEAENIKIEITKFSGIDIDVDNINNEIDRISNLIKNHENKEVISFNTIVDFLRKKKQELDKSTKEYLYIEFCLLVYKKLRVIYPPLLS